MCGLKLAEAMHSQVSTAGKAKTDVVVGLRMKPFR